MIGFCSADHKVRFGKLVQKVGAKYSEAEYMAALYLLGTPLFVHKVEEYVEYRQIRFSKLVCVAESWGSGEKALVRLAAALFNSCWKADLNEVFGALDAQNIELALMALRIRYGSVITNFMQYLVSQI